MIVRKSCFSQFCLLSILQIFIRFGKAENNKCKNSNEICQPLSQCQRYAGLAHTPYHTLSWCNIDDYVVCCPQVAPIVTEAFYYKDINKPYTEECLKWKKEIYSTCPPEGLIVAGKRARPKEFPHMALLGIKNGEKYDWNCGGTLVNQRYVLTAAHCMEVNPEDTPNRVRLGELDYSKDDDDALVQEFVIKNYTSHPDYNPEEFYYDIAVVELDGIVQINKYVVPICLPVTNGSENERLNTAGWGTIGNAYDKSPYLQKVTLERFDETNCQNIIGKPNAFEEGVNPVYHLCAGSYNDNRDTCQGDSGGPLFIEHPDQPCMYLLHGITSFGNACGRKGIPGVYTRVYPYIDWIESIVWGTNSQN